MRLVGGETIWRTTWLALVALVLAVSSLAATFDPASAAAATTTANLNLRQGPGISFSASRVVPTGTTVDVTGVAQFGYVPVTVNGVSGWVLETYVSVDEAAPTGTRYVFDGRLNLRSGPGLTYTILSVMPDGAVVTLDGREENGFARVMWNGQSGWAAVQYLTSSSASDGGSQSGNQDDAEAGTATTTARLYVRSGPGTTYGARTVVPADTEVELTGEADGDFTAIRYDGVTGWVASAFLATEAEDEAPAEYSMVTTAALNLRTGPGTDTSVRRVLPPGTAVTVTGAGQNGFVPVTWGTISGYVASDWLTEPGSADDPGTVIDGDEDIIAIIYAAADRWGQPRADMLRVARCESNLDPTVVNRSSGASGLFQFMPSTFAFTPNGKAGEDIFDPYSSADAAGWMWANGMRNHWECQ